MLKFDYPEGATPLDPNEIEGLLLAHITTRAELDRWEQDNINEALAWIEQRRPKNVLNETFMRQLHKRMFGNIWKWAGDLRKSDKNIGVPWYKIAVETRQLCDDAEYWIANKTFHEDEIAARFHHRLVSVHLFANGNGRHARLMADIILKNIFNRPYFTWGSANLIAAGTSRKNYIESLVAADKGDYLPLLNFVRS